MYLRIILSVPKSRESLVLSSVSLDIALLMRQTFANISGVTTDGFSAWEALTKTAVTSSNNSQSSISSKGVIILKYFGDSNISQSCGSKFVPPTAEMFSDQAESLFNLSTNNYRSKVVLILATCDRIGSVTTNLSIDGGKSSTTAYAEIAASITLSYTFLCSTMLSRGSVLTSPTSIGFKNYLANGGGYTASPPASTSCYSFKAYVLE